MPQETQPLSCEEETEVDLPKDEETTTVVSEHLQYSPAY